MKQYSDLERPNWHKISVSFDSNSTEQDGFFGFDFDPSYPWPRFNVRALHRVQKSQHSDNFLEALQELSEYHVKNQASLNMVRNNGGNHNVNFSKCQKTKHRKPKVQL